MDTTGKRDVFYLARSQTDGIIITQDGFHEYAEITPGLRRVMPPLPGDMSDTIWKMLTKMRDSQGVAWKRVEDNDKRGIFCRFSNQFFELDRNAHDMRVMLNLVMEVIQMNDRVILFQKISWDGEREWGELLMDDGKVMRFEMDSIGNTMNQKWSVAKEIRSVNIQDLLKLVTTTTDVGGRATGHFSFPSTKMQEKKTLLMSYVRGEPFIIHTEGPLEWIHENEAKECHSIFTDYLKLSEKGAL